MLAARIRKISRPVLVVGALIVTCVVGLALCQNPGGVLSLDPFERILDDLGEGYNQSLRVVGTVQGAGGEEIEEVYVSYETTKISGGKPRWETKYLRMRSPYRIDLGRVWGADIVFKAPGYLGQVVEVDTLEKSKWPVRPSANGKTIEVVADLVLQKGPDPDQRLHFVERELAIYLDGMYERPEIKARVLSVNPTLLQKDYSRHVQVGVPITTTTLVTEFPYVAVHPTVDPTIPPVQPPGYSLRLIGGIKLELVGRGAEFGFIDLGVPSDLNDQLSGIMRMAPDTGYVSSFTIERALALDENRKKRQLFWVKVGEFYGKGLIGINYSGGEDFSFNIAVYFNSVPGDRRLVTGMEFDPEDADLYE